MGFFTKKTSKPANTLPGTSAFIGTSADGAQQYNGSAHNAAVHRAQQIQQQAAKDAARHASIKQAIEADRVESARPQQHGEKVLGGPREAANIIDFPRHSSPMFLGEKTGLAADDRYKFVSLGLSPERFMESLVGIDHAEKEWGRNYHLSKSEKKKIDWPKTPDEAVGRFLKLENKRLEKDKIFVRFSYAVDPVIDEWSALALFPENQSQYNAWKQDMFR